GAMGIDAIDGRLFEGDTRPITDYLSIWAQNIIGGFELGASIDLAGLSGGWAAVGSGALAGAGFNALTFDAKPKSWAKFGVEQLEGAAFGAATTLAFLTAAPVIGGALGFGWKAISSVAPEFAGSVETLAGVISKFGGAVAEKAAGAVSGRFVVTEAEAWMLKPTQKIIKDLGARYLPMTGATADEIGIIRKFLSDNNLVMGIRAADPLTAAGTRAGSYAGVEPKPELIKDKSFFGFLRDPRDPTKWLR